MTHTWKFLLIAMPLIFLASYLFASGVNDFGADAGVVDINTAGLELIEFTAIDPNKDYSIIIQGNLVEIRIHSNDAKAIIEMWASDGTICEVLGHKWYNNEKTGNLIDYPNEWIDECSICEKERSRHLMDWE